ncbi:HVA22/TB2/DP1 family protein [Diplonema papillatum]|nr:HVA22/TB2/DP1 family protein [Diplonema papillatum]|eukprot:gene19176-29523_t
MTSAIALVSTLAYYAGDGIAFVYPGLQTLKSVMQDDKAETKWLVYWVVFSLFYTVEYFVKPILELITMGGYHWLRIAFILYLLFGGANYLYDNVLIPNLRKYLPDQFPKNSASSVIGRGVDAMNRHSD